jgi:K+-transporting ATPase A subunit
VIWPPWLIFLLVTALAIALLYQIVSRRFGWRVLGYWVFIFIGVMAFEALAETAGWNLTRVGDVRMLPDMVGAGLAVAILWFLGI